MPEPTGSYLHGTAPEEQRRLSLLNELLNERSLARLELRGGERTLDLGCGLGQMARAMARRLTSGSVVAVERDPTQLAEARRLAAEAGEEGLVEFRRAEAESPLARGELGSFDLAHARFLLEHVPRPERVMRALVEAVKPGGRVVVEDDDHDLLRLWPEVPGFEAIWRAYERTYDRLGNDPFVGRRLVSLLHGAGAHPSGNALLSFGSCAGDPAFDAFVANFLGLIRGAPEPILAASALTVAELEEGLERLEEWSRLPDAALWYATCWAEGRRPEEPGSASVAVTKPTPLPRGKVTSMQFLAASAADLTSSLELDEVFARIADRVQQLIDCHLFCVMLWSEERQLLEHSYSLRFGQHEPQEGGFPLGYGLSGSAALERRTLRVADVTEDPRYVRFRHAEVEIRSEMAVPLLVRDRLIGVLDLESQAPDAFTAEHEQIVTALASQIATALENARLYEELRANQRRVAADLQLAREVQGALLPRHPPRVPGLEIGAVLEPARELSGDFYDFLPLDGGRVAVALGDVAGKSTPAAVYASLAVGILRGRALERRFGPAAMLDQLNEQLWRLHVERSFVAMALAFLDGADRELRYANAGVSAPCLLRDGEIRRLEQPGLPLGGLERSRYEERRLRLMPGDVLVFFSDGIEECRGAGGETFGERRLAEVLLDLAGSPAQAIARGIVDASARFAAKAAEDDRTLVVVRVAP
ncbi:MAG: SpoIIE family protein phosphatase, partial [Thermoanaerobaculia bacterium]|nr:SpoIIE family protein phosphatase [Thermoanaerobaculia bacterium]